MPQTLLDKSFCVIKGDKVAHFKVSSFKQFIFCQFFGIPYSWQHGLSKKIDQFFVQESTNI